MVSPIAPHAQACEGYFRQLCALLENKERQAEFDISYLQVCDGYAQFKVWAGNIGAFQNVQSTSSLDYRLRDVPKISNQTVAFLEDLEETLEESMHSSSPLSLREHDIDGY